jgi:hypothetical protein
MKNTLSDLNDHLFAQLERLGNESMTNEQLAVELERARSITNVAHQIVNNGRLVLDAQVKMSEIMDVREMPKMPKMLM